VTAAAGQEPPARARVRVVVTVGTDHHPFDRLVHWVNDWLAAHPGQAQGFFMQSGSTTVVPACPWSRAVEVQRLDALLDEADVIVCHGGPATMAAAWARSLLPIVVPRLPQLGEHVDDHQLDFSHKLAELGRIRLAQTPAEFVSIMAAATRDPGCLRAGLPAADVDVAVARFGELVEDLVRRPHRLRRIGPGRRSRRELPTVAGVPAGHGDSSAGLTAAPGPADASQDSPHGFPAPIHEEHE